MTTPPSGDATLPKEKRIEFLSRLAEASWESMNKRRAYEWKVSFGLWTALGLLCSFALSAHLGIALRWILTACLGLISIVYVFMWTRGLHQRNADDKKLAEQYWKEIEKELSLDLRKQPNGATLFWADWSHGSQIIFTILLTAIAIASLWVQACPNAGDATWFH